MIRELLQNAYVKIRTIFLKKTNVDNVDKEFEEFLGCYKEYKYRCDEIIDLLFSPKVRNYIIEDKDATDCLISIIASRSNELRNFYFNEQTIGNIIKHDRLTLPLWQSKFYPNKIKLFSEEWFLQALTTRRNTTAVVEVIREEIEKNPDNIELQITLKEGVLTYFHYLKKDFLGSIEIISILMKKLPSEWYEEFLELILEDLKTLAMTNPEINYDEIFTNSYITHSYKEVDFEKIEHIVNKFKGINTLYYSFPLMSALLERAFDFEKVILNEEQLNRFHQYLFNDYCKNVWLKRIGGNQIENLYSCFSREIIDYLFDDNGLMKLEENNCFKKLLYSRIPYNQFPNSKLFIQLLNKNIKDSPSYDERIEYLTNSFQDEQVVFRLLDKNIEITDYDHFYRIFFNLSASKQLKYLKTHSEELFSLGNELLFQGIKREAYEIVKDRVDISTWCFEDDDLKKIIENKEAYSEEQLEIILSNPSNWLTILKSYNMEKLYKTILNWNNKKLNQLYMGDESLATLRKLNRLDRVYSIIDDIEIDIRPLILNTASLIEIGEEVAEKYKMDRLSDYPEMPQITTRDKYVFFFYLPNRLKDKTILFELLDFYLTNTKYLSTFYLLRKSIHDQKTLQEYFTSRKELITQIVKQNKEENPSWLIFGNLPQEILVNEFNKERELAILDCDLFEYQEIFREYFKGKYRLSEDILVSDRFIEKFIDYYSDLEELKRDLSLVTNREETIEYLTDKIKNYRNKKKELVESLNDSKEEFKTYLEVLMNSGVDVEKNEFLKDMIDIVFFNRRIPEVSLKYQGQNLEKIKLGILNELIRNSTEDIASSITNPLNKEMINVEYDLDGEKVFIPTIIYDEEEFIFLVRRMSSGSHIINGNIKEKVEFFSTITEKNRSMYHGDTGVKCGYVKINPQDIIQVNSYDAISKRSSGNKYVSPHLKYPEWISMKELNERTRRKGRYNEISAEGIYLPDYVISYDEPNRLTVNYSHKQNVPLVKILRKAYPNAIENNEDPYADWQ